MREGEGRDGRVRYYLDGIQEFSEGAEDFRPIIASAARISQYNQWSPFTDSWRNNLLHHQSERGLEVMAEREKLWYPHFMEPCFDST